jgi:uncharacterized protein (DUF1778 family)
MKRKEKARESGGARLVAAGRRPVSLGLLPAEYDAIKAAAEAKEMPMTEFVTTAAVRAAQSFLEKSSRK